MSLSVPRSPGDSPSPCDHFPDTFETKDEYDQHSQHPASLTKQRSKSPSLSSGIIITTPDETEREAHQVRERRKSLQINTTLLSETLHEVDTENTGYLDDETFIFALKQLNISINLNDDDIKIVLKDVTDEKGISITKLIGFISDQHSTLKLDSSKQWNSFRMRVISAKTKKSDRDRK